jgi:hypothetical protein
MVLKQYGLGLRFGYLIACLIQLDVSLAGPNPSSPGFLSSSNESPVFLLIN